MTAVVVHIGGNALKHDSTRDKHPFLVLKKTVEVAVLYLVITVTVFERNLV